MKRSSDFEDRDSELDRSVDAIAQHHVEDGADWLRAIHAHRGRCWAVLSRPGDDRRWQKVRSA